ncbi:E3 ubiquitin-protein ligase TRIM47-like isoform X2 [Paramormyrops kingsleyae]|uniref:E3 ubiquitin-protein ligase TRIM47-like isoform X2 n=1 Tax=Paramormyrops kingsleyae TaxID=1676925 RepID=UPI000CD5F26B|nr:tripartite motif-containing protein 47-like isoform X2 [Paramormyrops kingsleyae]
MCEKQLQCCICLDSYTNPVSIPCGHIYCLACIGEYWKHVDICRCPLCLDVFTPEAELKSLPHMENHSSDLCKEETPVTHQEVPCDVCLEGPALQAVQSCLVCLASYCPKHLEPHYQSAALRKHQLVVVCKNRDNSTCRLHGQPLKHFCRSDQTCICAQCIHTDHRGHRIVHVVKEWEKKKNQLKKIMLKTQRMIQVKLTTLKDVKQSADISAINCDNTTMEKSKDKKGELTLPPYCEAADGRPLELMEKLEKEISELEKQRVELEQLSSTEDPIHFLQLFPLLCTSKH